MSDFRLLLKLARESELEVRCGVEQIERLHRILRLQHRSEQYLVEMSEKLNALEVQVNDLIDEAFDRKREALALLTLLSGSERAVLYQYYILGKDWQKIAHELYMSERQVYKLRRQAMDKLEAVCRQLELQETCRQEAI